MLEPLDPEAASSKRKSGSHAPGSAAPDASPLIVLATPPRRSLPSAPHRFSVSSSSWSAPFIKTERHPHHLSRWSKIRGPLHDDGPLNALKEGRARWLYRFECDSQCRTHGMGRVLGWPDRRDLS